MNKLENYLRNYESIKAKEIQKKYKNWIVKWRKENKNGIITIQRRTID